MNKQVQRSRNWITKALMSLMGSKSYEMITISDITNEADIARPTFYRNFDSKDEVLLCKRQEIYEVAMTKLNELEECTPYEAIMTLVSVFNDYASFFGMLIQHNLEYIVSKDFDIEISNILLKAFNIDISDPFRVKFYEGALLSVILEWLKRSMKESPKSIGDRIYSYMTEVVA